MEYFLILIIFEGSELSDRLLHEYGENSERGNLYNTEFTKGTSFHDHIMESFSLQVGCLVFSV